MPLFRWDGDGEQVLSKVTNPSTGSTLVMKPGEMVELAENPGIFNLVPADEPGLIQQPAAAPEGESHIAFDAGAGGTVPS